MLILFIPFLTELLGDAWLISKKKKDIHWTVRCCLIVVVCLVYGWGSAGEILRGVLMALAPYPLFDPLLNIIRFKSIKAYAYIGRTKYWDRTMQHWKDEFGVKDWMFLAARIVVSGGLVSLYYVI